MRIGGGHRDNQKGAIAVVGVLKNSPYMAAYRFDADATGSSPWTAYPALSGSSIPSLSNNNDYHADIAVCPENNKVVVGGIGTAGDSYSSPLQVYDFDVSSSAGFGSITEYTATGISGGDSNDLFRSYGLAFSQNKKVLVVSSGKRLVAYNWVNGQITSVKWRHGNAPGRAIGADEYAYGAVGFWPYNDTNRDGPNEMVVGCIKNPRMGFQFYIETINLETGSQIFSKAVNTGYPTGYGFLQTPVKLSPLVVNGKRTAVGETLNTDNGRYYGFAYDLEDGGEGTSPSQNTNRIGNDEYTSYNMFNPYGQVISARTNPYDIRIYNQSLFTGQFSRVSKYSDDIGTWSGGHINSMAYDKDRDILFVCHRDAPYLTAVKMGRGKFVHKYTDISVSDQAGSAFVRASLLYDEKWKCLNS